MKCLVHLLSKPEEKREGNILIIVALKKYRPKTTQLIFSLRINAALALKVISLAGRQTVKFAEICQNSF